MKKCWNAVKTFIKNSVFCLFFQVFSINHRFQLSKINLVEHVNVYCCDNPMQNFENINKSINR